MCVCVCCECARVCVYRACACVRLCHLSDTSLDATHAGVCVLHVCVCLCVSFLFCVIHL